MAPGSKVKLLAPITTLPKVRVSWVQMSRLVPKSTLPAPDLTKPKRPRVAAPEVKFSVPVLPVPPTFKVELHVEETVPAPVMVPFKFNVRVLKARVPLVRSKAPPTVTFPVSVLALLPDVVRLLKVKAGMFCAPVPLNSSVEPATTWLEALGVNVPLIRVVPVNVLVPPEVLKLA